MKRALSLILALVMVTLMIPFAAFVTSAEDGDTDTGTDNTPQYAVELDKTKYSPVYSIDFTKIDNREELDEAGWVLMKDTSTIQSDVDGSHKALEYSDDGLYYKTSQTVNFTCGAVAFNSTDNYVIDYTFAYANTVRIFQMHFKVTDLTKYKTAGEVSGNGDRWCFRGDKSNMQWDNSTFRADATYGGDSLGNNLKGVDADAHTAVEVNHEDVRIRIFVTGGESKYAVMNVGEKEFYILDAPNEVVDGSYFSFSACDNYANGASRRVLMKDFSIYKYGNNEPAAAEKACVEVDGVSRYVAGDTDVKVSDYATDAILIKTADGYAAPVDFKAVAGEKYEIITKSQVFKKSLTAAASDLRLASNPGIRFKSGLDADDMAFIDLLASEGAITKLEMGTLVTVKAFRDQVDAFTAEKLEALEGNTYMNIVANAEKLYAENTFAGSVIGVKDLTRDYIAVGYVTVTFADGTTATVYTAEQTASVVGFANAIVEAETPNYDGYTADEVEALKYIAALDDVAA